TLTGTRFTGTPPLNFNGAIDIRVTADKVTATFAGQELPPLSSATVHYRLKELAGRHKDFANAKFDPSEVLGGGVGLFCYASTIVVRNLTVSKPGPPKAN
ncbi:MAG: hypothetical protein K2V38_16305, partial [Gemmataceae bacterium]|nr:hypothetical protein [Gemmataceae bacterium]